MASARRLLDHALGLLVDHVASVDPGSWRFGPLVIVDDADDAATAALEAAAAGRGASLAAGGVMTWSGETLAHEIMVARTHDRLDRFAATVAAGRLVVVNRIDRVAGDDARQSLVHLLDVSAAAGVPWCVSLCECPADQLGPQCDSRLRGGLVVRAPHPTPPIPAGGHVAPSVARVIRAVARHHDMTTETLLGPSRSRTVAVARSIAMYLARRLTGSSLQAIGTACGGRDHTTILHGVKACGERCGRDPAFAADIERLAARLTGAPAAGTRGRRRSRVGSEVLGRTVANRLRRRRRTA